MRTGPSVRLCLLHLPWTLTVATTAPLHSLQAREPWTGIVKPTNGNPPETTGPWPADPIMPGRHSVRYCWVSEDDYVELNDYVQKAIGLWQPAIGPEKALYSSLNFRPDGGKQQENILCKDASPDALHISVIPESAPYTTASSIGYQPAEEDEPGGNHMRILTKLPDMPDEAERRKARIVAVVAHELGHVIGLGHEFQRPDRDEYISFYCRNLKDYEAVKEKLEPGDTMAKACTDFHIAKKYKFSAMEWMPHRGGYIESIMPIAWSHTFDPISIMMYGSFAGSPNLVRKKSTAVMLAKKTKGARPNPENEVLVSSGGAPFDTTGLEWSHLCKLSEGDMARTAQLYPTKGPKGKEDPGNVRANNPKWVGSTVKQPARPVGA